MKCFQVKTLLSEFYDGELESARAIETKEHLANCEACSVLLAEFKQLSKLVKKQSDGSEIDSDWETICTGLNAVSHSPTVAISVDSETRRSTVGSVSWLAIAATLLLVAAGGWWAVNVNFASDPHHQFAMEFGQYLEQFERDPILAQEYLMQRYSGKPWADAQSQDALGYAPAITQGLPDGFTPVSTVVLNMPCCTCVQTVCQRSDGSFVVLFEHDDDETNEWFGDRPMRMETCNDKACQLVKLDENIGATWQRDSRFITMIAVRDKEEVERFVTWLDNSS